MKEPDWRLIEYVTDLVNPDGSVTRIEHERRYTRGICPNRSPATNECILGCNPTTGCKQNKDG